MAIRIYVACRDPFGLLAEVPVEKREAILQTDLTGADLDRLADFRRLAARVVRGQRAAALAVTLQAPEQNL